jgi:transcriptional regulator with XRE-family HTH domain
MDDTSLAIAALVRAERDRRSWTLSDLASRSGVARATISKIERGEMSPTATLLVKLAGAFDLTLAGLLLRAEGRGLLARAADRKTWVDPQSGYRRTQLFAAQHHPVELVSVELPASARVEMPASSYARIRQVVWLREGRLIIVEGGVPTVLEPGDCLGFGAPTDVVFANDTDQPCRYVVALARI